jgi:hypothetical protein
MKAHESLNLGGWMDVEHSLRKMKAYESLERELNDGWMKTLTLRDEAYESLDLDLNGWMDENTHFER